MKAFNKENAYDEKISPLMAQIIEICKVEGIPMFASFCFSAGGNPDDPDGKGFVTTHLPGPDGEFVKLYADCVKIVYDGYCAMPGVSSFSAMMVKGAHE